MKFDRLVKDHFDGNASKLAREFNLTPGAAAYWKLHGIPPLRQAQIELWLLKRGIILPQDRDEDSNEAL